MCGCACLENRLSFIAEDAGLEQSEYSEADKPDVVVLVSTVGTTTGDDSTALELAFDCMANQLAEYFTYIELGVQYGKGGMTAVLKLKRKVPSSGLVLETE